MTERQELTLLSLASSAFLGHDEIVPQWTEINYLIKGGLIIKRPGKRGAPVSMDNYYLTKKGEARQAELKKRLA